MSSRRSRFKVAANIPVRRKPEASTDPVSSEAKPAATEPSLGIENVLKVEERLVCEGGLQNAKNTEAKPVEIPPASTDNVEEKTFFKRIKPTVHLPVRKARNRPVLGNADEKKVGSEGPDSTATEEAVKSVEVPEPREPDRVPPISHLTELSSPLPRIAVWEKPSEARPCTPPSAPVPIPLSPAKSPARARFVRPALVDSAMRRQSFHASSASESEDDSRRHLNSSRNRKVSESSVVAKNIAGPSGQDTSRVDEDLAEAGFDEGTNECVRLALLPKRKRPKISNFVRKIAEARRNFNKKFAREKPDRSNLKMFDLIFYNPRASTQCNQTSGPSPKNSVPSQQELQLNEQSVDDPENEGSEGGEDGNNAEPEVAMPVPQVKIGANGEIILDEKSLVIETTEAKKCREAMLNSVPVLEEKNRKVSYFGKKHTNAKEWTPIETKCFYKALNSIGTDFALMQPLFPDRTRGELKNKFKREERVNSALVDRAISRPCGFNINLIKEEIEQERALVEAETKKKIFESMQKAQERCEFQSLKKSERDCGSVMALKNFTGHREPGEPSRRSGRAPIRRRLGEDYVDPFEVNENTALIATQEKSLKAQSVGINAQFKSVLMGGNNSMKEKAIPKRKAHTRKLCDDKINVPSRANASKKRRVDEDNGRNEDVSDNESVCSVNTSHSIEIGDNEFLELLNRKIQNMESSTIRVHAPSRSGDVRVVLDVGSQGRTSHTLPPRGMTYRVRNHFKIPVEPVENNFTIVEDRTIDESERTHRVTNHFKVPQQEAIENNITIDETVNAGKNTPDDFVSSIFPKDTELVYTFASPPPAPGFSDTQHQGSLEDEVSSDTYQEYVESAPTESQLETVEPSEVRQTKSSEVPPPLSEARVKYQGEDYQYAVIEAGPCPEQKKTYLAGLRPGSFVFMANETPNVPLERRCSMVMIDEKISSSGAKEFTPMPVVLPEELMKLITQQLNCKP